MALDNTPPSPAPDPSQALDPCQSLAPCQSLDPSKSLAPCKSLALRNKTHTLRAAAWMIGAVCSFSLMAIGGREVSADLSTFEIMAFRSAIGLPIIVFLVMRSGGWDLLKTRKPRQHILRNGVHFAAQNCWFYAIATIPIAQVIAIEFTSPLWILLFAPLLLSERLTRHQVVAAILGFIGVLIVARPGYSPLEIGHLTALLAAIGFALTNLTTKKLAATDSLLCIMFWMILSQMLMGFAVAVPVGLTLPSLGLMPWLVLTGICGLTAHYALTTALKIAPALVVAPMDFLRLPVLAIAAALLYGEPLDMALFMGAGLILAGNIANLRRRKGAPETG